ncbi:MAG: hypothetical protein RBR74_10295 [Ignavibacteriaceae bacterium]|jgi:hypothetical protein|nr:hypothetical protein [Ignavibacteriaceae bacterium]
MKNLLFVSLLFFLSLEGFSQNNHQYSIWGNFGGGLAFADYSNEGGGGFSLNYGISGKYDFYIASIKRHNNMEFSFKIPNEKLNSTSFLIGLSNDVFKNENNRSTFNINLLVGISYLEVYQREKQTTSGTFNDKYELNKVTSVGLPIELNAEFRLTSYIGLSATVFSNLNKYNSLLGVSANLIFGYL